MANIMLFDIVRITASPASRSQMIHKSRKLVDWVVLGNY